MSHGQRSLPRGHSWTGDQKGLPRGPYDPKRNGGGRSVFTRQMSITGGSKQGSKVTKSLVLPPREFPPGPFESPGYGYLTDNARLAWCEHRLGYFEGVPETTQADPDPSQPLYFWQLYSVMGEERIKALTQQFYTYVFNDENDWFRKIFASMTTMEMAIWSASTFFLDVMGGGRHYPGGYHRTSHKHDFTRENMTEDAARYWMVLMRKTLLTADMTSDPRVPECFLDFLEVHMHKYGDHYGFDAGKISYAVNANEMETDRPVAPNAGCPYF